MHARIKCTQGFPHGIAMKISGAIVTLTQGKKKKIRKKKKCHKLKSRFNTDSCAIPKQDFLGSFA